MERPIVMGAEARSQREITKIMGGRDLKRFGPSVVGGPWGVAGKGRQGLASRLGWLRGDGPMIREFRLVGNFDVYRRDSRKELGDIV